MPFFSHIISARAVAGIHEVMEIQAAANPLPEHQVLRNRRIYRWRCGMHNILYFLIIAMATFHIGYQLLLFESQLELRNWIAFLLPLFVPMSDPRLGMLHEASTPVLFTAFLVLAIEWYSAFQDTTSPSEDLGYAPGDRYSARVGCLRGDAPCNLLLWTVVCIFAMSFCFFVEMAVIVVVENGEQWRESFQRLIVRLTAIITRVLAAARRPAASNQGPAVPHHVHVATSRPSLSYDVNLPPFSQCPHEPEETVVPYFAEGSLYGISLWSTATTNATADELSQYAASSVIEPQVHHNHDYGTFDPPTHFTPGAYEEIELTVSTPEIILSPLPIRMSHTTAAALLEAHLAEATETTMNLTQTQSQSVVPTGPTVTYVYMFTSEHIEPITAAPKEQNIAGYTQDLLNFATGNLKNPVDQFAAPGPAATLTIDSDTIAFDQAQAVQNVEETVDDTSSGQVDQLVAVTADSDVIDQVVQNVEEDVEEEVIDQLAVAAATLAVDSASIDQAVKSVDEEKVKVGVEEKVEDKEEEIVDQSHPDYDWDAHYQRVKQAKLDAYLKETRAKMVWLAQWDTRAPAPGPVPVPVPVPVPFPVPIPIQASTKPSLTPAAQALTKPAETSNLIEKMRWLAQWDTRTPPALSSSSPAAITHTVGSQAPVSTSTQTLEPREE
ncbi:hypothetical protein BGX33_011899 [Mortierella sp. NVP41]|nr:hypothetical protein BGX33_011899 [Mortierella sp. NVP41]